MVLGISLSAFTTLHVIISLIGIGTGLVVLGGMLKARPLAMWTLVFLVTTALTSLTGYLFPAEKILPSHIVGGISLAMLAIAFLARYLFRMSGKWRAVYVVTAVISLYLNVFVLVVQSFHKVPALHQLAPTDSEPPFAISQLSVLIVFVVLGFFSFRRFHPK
jgi:hypothetical protein